MQWSIDRFNGMVGVAEIEEHKGAIRNKRHPRMAGIDPKWPVQAIVKIYAPIVTAVDCRSDIGWGPTIGQVKYDRAQPRIVILMWPEIESGHIAEQANIRDGRNAMILHDGEKALPFKDVEKCLKNRL